MIITIFVNTFAFLFSLKTKMQKYLRILSAAVVTGALRVNILNITESILSHRAKSWILKFKSLRFLKRHEL